MIASRVRSVAKVPWSSRWESCRHRGRMGRRGSKASDDGIWLGELEYGVLSELEYGVLVSDGTTKTLSSTEVLSESIMAGKLRDLLSTGSTIVSRSSARYMIGHIDEFPFQSRRSRFRHKALKPVGSSKMTFFHRRQTRLRMEEQTGQEKLRKISIKSSLGRSEMAVTVKSSHIGVSSIGASSSQVLGAIVGYRSPGNRQFMVPQTNVVKAILIERSGFFGYFDIRALPRLCRMKDRT
mmetsp:Transcript_30555/g.51439  ORF Transcript_30555/g.51439 Transcript_30555/m.51439 type:complete len:238 (+) Transcript_30555:1862-2575(+)